MGPRISLSMVAALSVFVVACLAAWVEITNNPYYLHPQRMTQSVLETVHTTVNQHRETEGDLPEGLADLATEQISWPTDANNLPIDEWGNPLIYAVTPSGFDLISYGRDGLLGGEGIDADLYSDGRNSSQTRVTYQQFLSDPGTGGIAASCFLSGLVAFGLSFALIGEIGSGPREWLRIVGRLGLAVVLSLLTAAVMTLHYIPSGGH